MSIGKLLSQGIGDTIRVSLTADPVEEIKIGYEILKSLDLRSRGVKIISCPSCARQAFPVIETVKTLEQKLSHIKKSVTVSIIGCIVNGPGEALNSDIGVTGVGNGSNRLYLSGVTYHKISNEDIVTKVVKLVEEKVAKLND
jgi:(E)-4-hydroxy-3-methylbut-2-enyl-diphosphate synthase